MEHSASKKQGAPHRDAASIRRLASQISGYVITPEMPDYESARVVFNHEFDRRPALMVRCASASDVARSLDFATATNPNQQCETINYLNPNFGTINYVTNNNRSTYNAMILSLRGNPTTHFEFPGIVHVVSHHGFS